MKQVLLFALLFSLSLSACNKNIDNKIDSSLKTAEIQIKQQLMNFPVAGKYPRTIDKQNKVYATPMNDWTEGFFPGCLWYLYEANGNDQIKTAAIKWTEKLEPLKYMTHNHDIGFIMYCSFGNAYRLTGDKKYEEILIQSANSLCTRFNSKIGAIESWDGRKAWNGNYWNYPVIIDNMMNLELLYFASKLTGNPIYAKIATAHAETTMKNHFRSDFSCYHVVDYDTITGNPIHKQTCQGYADNSTWSRGQAWAIYGYTMVYRETGNERFLKMAENVSSYWLNNKNMPSDGIPYWDFNVGQKGFTPDWKYEPKTDLIPRDASAAAIACSAFLELSTYVKDGEKYKKAANKILNSLMNNEYMANPGTNGNFIIKHCVGSYPHNSEIDVPLVYADYYFLEALNRFRKLNKKECSL